MESETETTGVIICGCGPTGAMLSAYLGKMDVPNIVLEKESDITTDPRGIVLDEDGIRSMQGLGLYGAIFSEIGTAIRGVRFVSGVHSDLHRKELFYIDTGSTAGRTGHVGLLGQKQPALEKHLRAAMSSTTQSTLRSGCNLISISEDEDWVYVKYTDPSGVEKTLRGRFLVGSDGKTGFTRKQYLEAKGVQMLWAEGSQYQESWVALNWKINLPTPETHPDFPLWRLGYSPLEVYDKFFPRNFTFLCNPNRPAVCGRFGLESDRLWRFEFVVAEGEDDTEMAKPEMIQKVVFPYLKHPGSRYGLKEDVEYPQDCIEVLRCRPFRFYARSCNKWAVDRVILCGDAAHVFPPFGGQGIASGFRDAIALSWRLALMCRSRTVDYRTALGGWYLERKQQLEMSLAATLRNGDMVNSRNSLTIFLRDWGLWLLQMIPSIRRRLQMGPRAAGVSRYQYSPGMAFMPELGGGYLFAQTFCVEATNEKDEGVIQFTDDVIFSPEKTKLFQIIILLDDMDQVASTRSRLEGLDDYCTHLSTKETTTFVRRRTSTTRIKSTKEGCVFRTATGGEFAKSRLCDGRPDPYGYDEEGMWDGVKGKKFVIVRHDRFVFAVCGDRIELESAATRLQELFP